MFHQKALARRERVIVSEIHTHTGAPHSNRASDEKELPNRPKNRGRAWQANQLYLGELPATKPRLY